MTLSTKRLAEFVANLKGIVPEPARTLMCHRLVGIIANTLYKANPEAYRNWLGGGRIIFVQECYLTTNLDRWVSDDLHVEATKLALFCDKWMSVEAFRLKNEPDAEWQPITPDQNALRFTMIEELKELAKQN